jgi:hypothetical protein
VQAGGVLLRDPHGAGGKVARDPCAQLDRRPVGGDGDGRAVADAVRLGVLGRELDLGVGALELQLGGPFDGRPGEERLVRDQP